MLSNTILHVITELKDSGVISTVTLDWVNLESYRHITTAILVLDRELDRKSNVLSKIRERKMS